MKRVGAHVSTTGGVQNAPLKAAEIGAKAFALFTRNQRQWKSKPLQQEEIVQFKANCEDCGLAPRHILPHDSYLINLGSADENILQRSWQAFSDEMRRCEELGLRFLNLHPGSHKNEMSEQESLDQNTAYLNRALEETSAVILVLENTAGQGSNLGYTFEHLAYIVERIEDKNRIGVCLDTCHLFAAGYDIRTAEGYQRTMLEFDDLVGLGYLKAFHLNDSKSDLGSRVDRHDSLGKGLLGWEPFRAIMNDPRLDEMPLILETVDRELWAREIEVLYGLVDR
jgi:deoxyribonuclease-4